MAMQDQLAWERPEWRRADARQTLMFMLVASAVMLFTTFSASYVIRRAGSDWTPIRLPAVVWINTALLALSHLSIEFARASRRKAWLAATLALGAAFAAGQGLAWAQLARAGVFASSGPHAAFVWMLTAVHVAHLAAGLVALAWAWRRGVEAPLGACAVWWHTVGALWVWVLILLTLF